MRNKQTKRRPYTMVEILLVLAISLLLVGLGSASVSALTGRRGLNGAVTIVSSQVNLARSVAVSQNRYVALLLPEPFSEKTADTSEFKPFFCNRMRLCLVTPDLSKPGTFNFAGWIEGYDWVQLPTRTCAHPIFQYDLATLDKSNRKNHIVNTVVKISVFESGGEIDKCAGIVFAPNGRLASYGDAMIQVYNALPNAYSDGKPDMRDLKVSSSATLQGSDPAVDGSSVGNLPYRRWCVSINKLTGRTEVTYAQPPEK